MSPTKKQLKLVASIKVLQEMKSLMEKEEKRKVVRRYWIKPLLLTRMDHDLEAHLLHDLIWEDDDDSGFRNYTRIDVNKFEELLQLVQNGLKKSDTVMRLAVTPRLKLCVTLRYIVTGDSYKSLEFLTRLSRNTISAFVPIVLEAIYQTLQENYLKMPNTEIEWQQIAADFEKIWQFPHTLGALDGKHIRIKAPANSGSQFLNFKAFSASYFLLLSMHIAGLPT